MSRLQTVDDRLLPGARGRRGPRRRRRAPVSSRGGTFFAHTRSVGRCRASTNVTASGAVNEKWTWRGSSAAASAARGARRRTPAAPPRARGNPRPRRRRAPRRRLACVTALAALSEAVVGEHERHHRLDDRHRARQHAGVVAAARLDRGVVPVLVDGLLLAQDRRRRLERDADDDVLAVRDAALDAARAVGARADAAVAVVERIVVLAAGQVACRRSRCRSRSPWPPAATSSPWRGRPPACRTPARPGRRARRAPRASTTPPSESPALRASSMRAIMRSARRRRPGSGRCWRRPPRGVTRRGIDVDLEVLHPLDPRDDLERRRDASPAPCARSRRRRPGPRSRARWRGRRPARRGCRTSPRRCSRRATGGTWSASPRSRRERLSWLRTSIAIGVPSVRPSCTPGEDLDRSGSRRWVVMALWPGRRRSSSRWISAASSGRRGGQPSTTTPTAGPCDSPKVVTRNSEPKLLPPMQQ